MRKNKLDTRADPLGKKAGVGVCSAVRKKKRGIRFSRPREADKKAILNAEADEEWGKEGG